jgi:predicted acetyltransferase
MLRHAPRLFESFRKAHAGQIARRPLSWETRLGLREAPWMNGEVKPPRCVLYVDSHDEPSGYLLYRVRGGIDRLLPDAKMEVVDLVSTSDQSYQGLWQYACAVDLVTEITAGGRPTDEPLPWLLRNARAAVLQNWRSDLLWLRVLHVAPTLSARHYLAPGQVVLEVIDPMGLSGGRFALDGGPDGATCAPTDTSADVTLGLTALGALILGGHSAEVLRAAGALDEHTPGAVQRLERMFHTLRAPWCSTFF